MIKIIFKALLLIFGMHCLNCKAQTCNKQKVEGYIIYFRDTIGYHDIDVDPNRNAYYYYYENGINYETINRYFSINDTFEYMQIDKPWGGFAYIDYKQKVNFEKCLEKENITFEQCQSYRLFSGFDKIPMSLINANARFISIYKFKGDAFTGFTTQNNLNKNRSPAIIVLPNAENKLEYLFSIVGPEQK